MRLRPGGLEAGRFLERFLGGEPLSTADALGFGCLLRERLLSEENLERWWERLLLRHRTAGRPLRVQALLPPGAGSRVSEIPLELLADEKGFVFRRGGNRLVRSVLRMRSTEVVLTPGDRAALAWANPVIGDPPLPLDPSVFALHEGYLREFAAAVGLEAVAPPCREATPQSFARYLAEHGPIALLSVVAHGDPAGGSLLLHLEGHPDFPHDPGDPLRARDAARLLREAGVKMAFLWSCHGGRHHAAFGAVAEALLDPEHGDVPVVVASQAALRADTTVPLFGALIDALAGAAKGDFERAVQEARAALAEDDLQWAALIYYTRPLKPVVFPFPLPGPPVVQPVAQAARLEGAPGARELLSRARQGGGGRPRAPRGAAPADGPWCPRNRQDRACPGDRRCSAQVGQPTLRACPLDLSPGHAEGSDAPRAPRRSFRAREVRERRGTRPRRGRHLHAPRPRQRGGPP